MAVADAHFNARSRPLANSSRRVNDAMTGTAKNTAEEWHCTANTAVTVAPAAHHNDPFLRSPSRTSAIVILTNARASGGFQMVALRDISSGAVATASVTASASGSDPNRFQMATSRSTSAA